MMKFDMNLYKWTFSSFKAVLKTPTGTLSVLMCGAFGAMFGAGHAEVGPPEKWSVCRQVIDPEEPAPAADCWNFDACTDDLDCHRQGTVWVKIMPANKLQYKSGSPVVPLDCHRISYSKSPCTTANKLSQDTFPRESCGKVKIVIDPTPEPEEPVEP